MSAVASQITLESSPHPATVKGQQKPFLNPLITAKGENIYKPHVETRLQAQTQANADAQETDIL